VFRLIALPTNLTSFRRVSAIARLEQIVALPLVSFSRSPVGGLMLTCMFV